MVAADADASYPNPDGAYAMILKQSELKRTTTRELAALGVSRRKCLTPSQLRRLMRAVRKAK